MLIKMFGELDMLLLTFVVILLSIEARDNAPSGESLTNCPTCDMRSCPLVSMDTCMGVIMKDSCGCCPECQPLPSIDPEEGEVVVEQGNQTNACAEIKCPRNEVCLLNIQGLPVCRCPTAFYCKQRPRQKVCSTDGETFSSVCLLKMTACEENRKITVERKGACEKPVRDSKAERARQRRQRLSERKQLREEKTEAKKREKEIKQELRRQAQKEDRFPRPTRKAKGRKKNKQNRNRNNRLQEQQSNMQNDDRRSRPPPSNEEVLRPRRNRKVRPNRQNAKKNDRQERLPKNRRNKRRRLESLSSET